MRQAVLMMALAAMPANPLWGQPAAAVPFPVMATASKDSALASQDPLMRQILYRQITQDNGGITAAVRVASGKSVVLPVEAIEPKPSDEAPLLAAAQADPSGALTPIAGLQPAKGQPTPTGKSSTVKKPVDQLKALAKQGTKQNWGEGVKTGSEKPVAVDVSTEKKAG
jgi:hypothetical protein